MKLNKIEILKKRSQAMQKLRAFFYARNVYEVDTPMLSQAATTDVHLRSLQVDVQIPGMKHKQPYYLHTSPEYPMKRLLCAGSGDIFYLGKVFRDGDLSPRHQPEFTMLEWYRLDFDLQQIMQETAEIVQLFVGVQPIEFISYQQAFEQYAGLADIHLQTAENCRNCLKNHQVPEIVGVDADDKPLWEQLLLTEVIEPQLGQDQITCLYHYPAREASLARLSATDSQVAERFELFFNGMELANGYWELQQADLYAQRFQQQQQQREASALPKMPIDQNLLDTLAKQALPDCSGVALGFDRLLALSLGLRDISEVISFAIDQA